MPQESYGSLFTQFPMRRMPGEITFQVAKKVTEDIWPIEEILDTIRMEIEAQEFSENVTVSRKPQKPLPKRMQRKHVIFAAKDTLQSSATKYQMSINLRRF